ncbi:hypothetical protein HMPREF0742_00576 [Rothia aeria F0184]|uniref:Uncharacterized protein n=1 Tax=Rothia aeria F0184 TaxID=888019 RepID=U7V7S4_9MICC|nr:hypothetical protein HMPREF0742_00576 [Rothia aeria F0184]
MRCLLKPTLNICIFYTKFMGYCDCCPINLLFYDLKPTEKSSGRSPPGWGTTRAVEQTVE